MNFWLMKAKFVVDTNVLISAALSNGVPFQVIEYLSKKNALVFSKETINELASRIMKPKFDKYVSIECRESYVNNLILSSEVVIIDNLNQGCRDKDDDKFLETALKSESQAIISGDKDLLVMHPFQGVEIITPQEFSIKYLQ